MIAVEIDGERMEFDDFYDDAERFGLGGLYGCNETTKPEDKVRNYLPTKAVWGLAAYRRNPDGSFFGLQGLFARGEWAKTEDGELLYRVWDRII